MTRIHNDPADVVPEALAGFAASHEQTSRKEAR